MIYNNLKMDEKEFEKVSSEILGVFRKEYNNLFNYLNLIVTDCKLSIYNKENDNKGYLIEVDFIHIGTEKLAMILNVEFMYLEEGIRVTTYIMYLPVFDVIDDMISKIKIANNNFKNNKELLGNLDYILFTENNESIC